MAEFATPDTASGIVFDDLKGALLLIEPLEQVHGINTTFGKKDAIRANVAVLDGTLAGEAYIDTLIFPLVLQGQVKSRIGQKVLGRLEQGVAKPGQKPPWKLAEATEADKALGVAHLASGFTAPTAASNAAPF